MAVKLRMVTEDPSLACGKNADLLVPLRFPVSTWMTRYVRVLVQHCAHQRLRLCRCCLVGSAFFFDFLLDAWDAAKQRIPARCPHVDRNLGAQETPHDPPQVSELKSKQGFDRLEPRTERMHPTMDFRWFCVQMARAASSHDNINKIAIITKTNEIRQQM